MIRLEDEDLENIKSQWVLCAEMKKSKVPNEIFSQEYDTYTNMLRNLAIKYGFDAETATVNFDGYVTEPPKNLKTKNQHLKS